MNRRIIKLLVLLVCLALTGIFFVVSIRDERHCDVQFVDSETFDLFCASLTQTDVPITGGSLMIEGYAAPYSKDDGCYYIPQSLSTDGVDGTLTWSNASETAIFDMDTSFTEKAESIRAGRAYRIMIQSDSEYYIVQAVFTGVPAISIQMESDNSTFEWDSTAIASVAIFDPDRDGTGGYGVDVAQAEMMLRGTSSINYEKKSYNITLYDDQGTRNGLSLLGMEKSDRWILKSLTMDPLRTRECVSSGIWNSICADNPGADIETSDFQYTEVFLDDAYYGLFGLMTKIDYEDCVVDAENDVAFKAQSYDFLYYKEEDFQLPLFAQSGIRFPAIWREGVYDPIFWYVDAIHLREPEITYEEIKAHMEMDNIIDYALFFMLVSARDNNYTNTIYLFLSDGDGFKTTLIPWDMDMTFGNSWNTVWTGAPLSLTETETVLLPLEIRAMSSLNESEMNALLSARWFELRESVLSDDALIARIKDAFSLLESSGAISREEARWTQPQVQRDEAYMLEYIRQRAAFMDQYFA